MIVRSKPVICDIFQVTKDIERRAPVWFGCAVANETAWIDRTIIDGAVKVYGVTLHTKIGRVKAKIGDYVIRGPDGELYPVKKEKLKEYFEIVK